MCIDFRTTNTLNLSSTGKTGSIKICLVLNGTKKIQNHTKAKYKMWQRTIFILTTTMTTTSLLCSPVSAAWTSGPSSLKTPLVVVLFGRPGSGKTTIAEQAREEIQEQNRFSRLVVGLDLDDCIPQWMRDNFANGIYPTLKERQEVAKIFCDYVEDQCRQLEEEAKNMQKQGAVLVSFSFVNTDLRDIFREKFPCAVWVLVDTSEEEANKRIRQRKGHFYSGKPSTNDAIKVAATVGSNLQETDEKDNTEWNFAPVDFPHTILDGNQPIATNAKIVCEIALQQGAV